MRNLDAGWARLWEAQVESFFDVKTCMLPVAECGGAALADLMGGGEDGGGLQGVHPARGLADSGQAAAAPEGFARWHAALRLSAELMDAAAAVRHIPVYHPDPPVPQKCTLLGTYEQMGPAELGRSNRFWRQAGEVLPANRIRDNERLCAVSLVKRLAFDASLNRRLGVEFEDTRFPSTQDIAWRGGEAEGDGVKPAYYAVLLFDGDELGKWLSGEKAPRSRWERLAGEPAALGARRPVTPAVHGAISEALSNFALRVAPRVWRGTAAF